jgi:hypothetical protein
VYGSLKYKKVIERIIESSGIQKKEKALRDINLALVTVYEFLFGEGFHKDNPYKVKE